MSLSNLELERQVLGLAMVNERHLNAVLDRVRESDFVTPKHREILAGIRELSARGEGVDLVSVGSVFPAYSAELSHMTTIATDGSGKAPIERLQNLAMLRELSSIAEQLKEAAGAPTADSAEILEGLEEKLTAASLRSAKDYTAVAEMVSRMRATYEERRRGTAYIPSGFSRFDTLSGGIRPGELVVIGGRTGLGKTSLALSIARNMVTQRPGAIVSLEMSAEEIGERWASALSRTPLGAIRNGALDESKRERFEEALGNMAERRLFIYDEPGATLGDIRSIARKLRRVEGIEFLAVDYVGLIRQTSRSQNRFDFIGECSRAFKILARELNIPVILLSQLNRLAEGQRPSLSHIRESGSLEQDSDKILLLHREREVPAGVNLIETELIVAKNRAGRTGIVPLVFRGDSTSFHEQVLYQEAN